MNLRFLTVPLFAALFILPMTGCKTTEEKEKEAEKKAAAARNMDDPSEDVSYQAFVGRLRKAVEGRNVPLVASMMTANFGYLLEPQDGFSGEGAGVFEYWEKKGLWDELELVLRERFVPKGGFMVAPAEFADETGFKGYRAGITMVNGSWRFAYFVAG